MGVCRIHGLFALAALVCLPNALSAQQSYTIQLPAGETPTSIEWSLSYGSATRAAEGPVTTLGDWEVEVELDAAHCQIHCTYRQKRDALGRTASSTLLLPPLASIRVYSGESSKPICLSLDPGGLGYPKLAGHRRAATNLAFLPRKRSLPQAPEAGSLKTTAPASSPTPGVAEIQSTAAPASLPLRV